MIQVRAVRGEREYDMVQERAGENGHTVLNPTHMILKDGEVVGAFGLEVSCVSWWMHDEKSGKRDNLAAYQVLEALLSERGATGYMVPCEAESPYHGMMETMGSTKFKGNWSIFAKVV